MDSAENNIVDTSAVSFLQQVRVRGCPHGSTSEQGKQQPAGTGVGAGAELAGELGTRMQRHARPCEARPHRLCGRGRPQLNKASVLTTAAAMHACPCPHAGA